MRALFNLIWKQHFFFLFVLLEVVSYSLVVNNNNFHRAGFVHSSNAVTGGIYSAYNGVMGYFGLRQENDMLAEENARLRTLLQMTYGRGTQEPIRAGDGSYGMQYLYMPAGVLAGSVNRRNNYLTLDKGFRDGVRREMGVISSDGAVGIVKNVSTNFSSVMLLLHKDIKLSARLSRSKYFGVIEWDGSDPEYLTMVDVPLPAEITIGDTVVTSGASAIFSEGVLIGTVDRHEALPGDNFYTVRVWCSVNFANLSRVYVINNLRQREQRLLENTSQREPGN